MGYINPIPYIDKAKKFEMRLHINLNEVTEINEAKSIVADYILSLSKEGLCNMLSCEMFPVYPNE